MTQFYFHINASLKDKSLKPINVVPLLDLTMFCKPFNGHLKDFYKLQGAFCIKPLNLAALSLDRSEVRKDRLQPTQS